MSRRNLSFVLFAMLVLTAPLPFFLVETGWVPLLRLVQLSAYSIALIVAEGGQGAVTMAAAILVVQALVYVVVLAVVASVLSGALTRLGAGRAALVTVALVIGCVAAAASIPVYRTPFSTSALHSSLLGVFR